MPGLSYRKTAAILVLVAGPAVLVFALGAAGLRLNATPSVPTGVYWISSDPAAEYVEFCPPEPFGTLSVARGYRAQSSGPCPDRGVPLLKRIVARSGDIVEVSASGIFVNRIPIPNTATKSLDTAGRPLVAWPAGRYEVARGTVWVASSYNPRSFDSRYFGPITETAIQHRLRPIWTE
jgi:conjugative transfer signal peptidase TraF